MDPKRNGNGLGGLWGTMRAFLRSAGAGAAQLARRAYWYVSALPAPVRLAGITAACFLLLSAILLPAAVPKHPEAFIFAYGEVESGLAEHAGTEASPVPEQGGEAALPESTPDPGTPGTEEEGEQPFHGSQRRAGNDWKKICASSIRRRTRNAPSSAMRPGRRNCSSRSCWSRLRHHF